MPWKYMCACACVRARVGVHVCVCVCAHVLFTLPAMTSVLSSVALNKDQLKSNLPSSLRLISSIANVSPFASYNFHCLFTAYLAFTNHCSDMSHFSQIDYKLLEGSLQAFLLPTPGRLPRKELQLGSVNQWQPSPILWFGSFCSSGWEFILNSWATWQNSGSARVSQSTPWKWGSNCPML